MERVHWLLFTSVAQTLQFRIRTQHLLHIIFRSQFFPSTLHWRFHAMVSTDFAVQCSDWHFIRWKLCRVRVCGAPRFRLDREAKKKRERSGMLKDIEREKNESKRTFVRQSLCKQKHKKWIHLIFISADRVATESREPQRRTKAE